MSGMASKKITVTVGEPQVGAIRAMVRRGEVPSVSAFVPHAIDVALADVAGWGAELTRMLAKTGGPLTKTERTWADEALSVSKRRPRRRANAA